MQDDDALFGGSAEAPGRRDNASGANAEPAREDPLRPLMERARAGDRAATRPLLQALIPLVHRVVRGVLGSQHPDVDDTCQTALVAVHQAVTAFRGDCKVTHYAARIASHVAMRQRKKRHALRAREDAEQPVDALHAAPETADALPEVWRSLLLELPENQAETVILRVVLECSLEETAEATGVPVNTVRSRVRLAREALRARIERDPRYRHLREEGDAP